MLEDCLEQDEEEVKLCHPLFELMLFYQQSSIYLKTLSEYFWIMHSSVLVKPSE